MRKLLCLFALAVGASAATSAASAQDQTSRVAPPASLVFAAPVWAEAPVTASPGNPYTSGGGGRRGGFRNDPSRPQHVREAVARAHPRPYSSARFGFPSWREASVELTNAGAREVRAVRLDFVFTDAPGGAEVLRLSLRARKRLRAGETKILRKTVKGTPTNRRGDGAQLSVEVKEIVYSDGTAWRPS